jgi:hypothetical protein
VIEDVDFFISKIQPTNCRRTNQKTLYQIQIPPILSGSHKKLDALECVKSTFSAFTVHFDSFAPACFTLGLLILAFVLKLDCGEFCRI